MFNYFTSWFTHTHTHPTHISVYIGRALHEKRITLSRVLWMFNQWLRERLTWLVAFANFLGVNTPSVADFKLPTWCQPTHEILENGEQSAFGNQQESTPAHHRPSFVFWLAFLNHNIVQKSLCLNFWKLSLSHHFPNQNHFPFETWSHGLIHWF